MDVTGRLTYSTTASRRKDTYLAFQSGTRCQRCPHHAHENSMNPVEITVCGAKIGSDGVANFTQWLCFVFHRWQKMSCRCAS